ncbi:MAG: LLM class flavin-dependent oxidoreductase [Acidimicrobiia bacterium]|nr:LLM class flavin-dependent oxidoreductase [Acidimicrobiia bacterium]
MKHALFLPPFGELADPIALAEIAVAAEGAGWDGVFLWDHILRPASEPPAIADPWIAMAAIAMATERIRIGPMVTPLTRRRPIKLARETVTLDHLSRGRLTLGLGLGVDTSRELSAFGEIVDPRTRGDRLDEGSELLCALWGGKRVDFHGDHFEADGVTVLPRPVQRPRIPMWFAARDHARRPVRRAAHYEGLVPVDVDEAALSGMLDLVRRERGSLEGFDVAVVPDSPAQYGSFAELGATWALTATLPGEQDVMSTASSPPADVFAGSHRRVPH